MKSILTFGTKKEKAASSKDRKNNSDDDQEIEVGDGCFVERSLLTFKALVFDTNSQNIMAPIMKVGALRDCNILSH